MKLRKNIFRQIRRLHSFLLNHFYIMKNRWICKLSKLREERKKIVIMPNFSSKRRMYWFLEIISLFGNHLDSQHLTSNNPSTIFYSVFDAEILWTVHTTSKYKSFCRTSEDFISIMWNKGGDIIVFTMILTKGYNMHFQTFWTFYSTSTSFMDSFWLKNFDRFFDG